MFTSDESVETGSCCFYTQPGTNGSRPGTNGSRPGTNGSRPVDMFRILRVVYSKPIGQLLVSLPVIQPVTYQTFTPQHVRVKELGVSFKERLEKMKETFDKVTAFLQTTGVTTDSVLFSSRRAVPALRISHLSNSSPNYVRHCVFRFCTVSSPA